jgi:uncharacterized BrkB/YihY/UPF0761 family membrane protein
MLWLYLTAMVLLVGAAINSVLTEMSSDEAEITPKEPLGDTKNGQAESTA